MPHHRKLTISSKRQLELSNSKSAHCWQEISICLHNGSIKDNGKITLSFYPMVTKFGQSSPIHFHNFRTLARYVAEKGFKFNLYSVAKYYQGISRHKRLISNLNC